MDRLSDMYTRHAPDCLRLAYLLTGDRALAEDLVQDAFVRVSGRFVHLRNPQAFGHYLQRTVVNLTKNHFRRRSIERSYLERQGRQPEARHDTPEAARMTVRAALLGLPERQRAAIVLRFWLDMPEHQVAELLRCRPGTVRSLVSRGMAALRDAIGDGDE